MNNQKGFTLIELMAVVCIIAILATISLPVFNHYIEKARAAAGLASLGTFKDDVAVCFMHNNTFAGCDSNTNGIHPETQAINWVNDVQVQDGTVVATLVAANHFAGQDNVTIALVPSAQPQDAAMNWKILCSDYNAATGTQLIDTCTGVYNGPSGSGSYYQ